MAGRFEAAYREGTPPWDIGKAQGEVVRLADSGVIEGRVIDVGCGTGENALLLASRGLDVTGVDSAPLAIERARAKAESRGLHALFAVRDVLDLQPQPDPFDCAIDSGCFHVFDDADRPAYVRSVRGVLRTGGRLYLLCFSDREPGTWGPRRVTRQELRDAFSSVFTVAEIRAAHFDVGPGAGDGATIEAWLGTFVAR